MNSNYLSGATELPWSQALGNEVHIGALFMKHRENISPSCFALVQELHNGCRV